MCGRYSLTKPPDAMRQLFAFRGNLPNLPPRYNIAPSQDAPVIRLSKDSKERELAQLHWGHVPSWSNDPKIAYSTINARAETVASKPAFRAAFKARRCLIPADGFYEWRRPGLANSPIASP
ncbi:MAG: SOS response-associated peptidase [Alphaproteobacteria bacterium]